MLLIPPVTKLELSDKMMPVVLSALVKLPYEVAQPVLVEIERQLGAQQPKDPPAPPTPPNPPTDLKTAVGNVLKSSKRRS